MPINQSARTLRRVCGTSLLAIALSLTGCATMNPNAAEESSFAPDWSSSLRLPPANSELSGLSNESRDIERSLGYE